MAETVLGHLAAPGGQVPSAASEVSARHVAEAAPTVQERPLARALLMAAIYCAHDIDEERVVLYVQRDQPGHNALNQLSRRLAAAIEKAERAREKVALDIAKWFVNGDRPDEFKLKEWAEALDRDVIGKAYEWRSGGSSSMGAALANEQSLPSEAALAAPAHEARPDDATGAQS